MTIAQQVVSVTYPERKRASGYEGRMPSLHDEPRECGQDPELVFLADTQGATRRVGALSEMQPICRRCPVYALCLIEGLAVEVVGVWGGRDSRERKAIRRRFAIEPEPVGPNNRQTTPRELAAVAAVTELVEQRVREWLVLRRILVS